jgi:hypothetical protein
MTEESIDYQALYESVQNELEQARITILKMRHASTPFDRLNGDNIRHFVNKNYVVIVVCIMILTFLVSSLKTIKGLFDTKE